MIGWNQLSILIVAALAYVLSGLVMRSNRNNRVSGLWVIYAGFLAHTIYLIMRAIQCDGFPVSTRIDSVATFFWISAAVFFLVGNVYRFHSIARFFWPAFGMCMAAMLVLANRDLVDRPSLERTWLLLHLIPVYIGYAAFAVAAGAGMAYLTQQRFIQNKDIGSIWRGIPSLETLDAVGRSAVSLGFPLFTAGLVVGVFWAVKSSAPLGRVWYADPKVISGLVVWVIYSGVLHLRLRLVPRETRGNSNDYSVPARVDNIWRDSCLSRLTRCKSSENKCSLHNGGFRY